MRPTEYESLRYMSQSAVKDAWKSWKIFFQRHIARTMPYTSTDSMELGTALHAALLEPDKFREHVLCIPENVLASNGAKSGNAWKQFQAENANRILLKSKDFVNLAKAADAVARHPKAGPVIAAKGMIETPVLFEWDGTNCKSLLDKLISGKCIVDVKTTSFVEADEFRRQAESLFYDVQAAFYQEGVYRAYGERLPFLYIAVELETPYRVRAYQAPEEWYDSGRQIIEYVLSEYQRRLETNDWEDVGDKEIILLEKMRWR